jgi:ubiquitin-small subunit ribosomal protein S27Ae
MAPKKEAKGKGKGQEKKKKEGKKLSSLFDISGDGVKRKNRNCPKCGPGMFMAKHKDRIVCGQCQYTEFTSKKEEETKKSE